MSIGPDTFVLSLGGSLVYPLPVLILNSLKRLMYLYETKSPQKRGDFYSGGWRAITRQYQAVAQAVRAHDIENIELDWLGIHATRLNAQMVRTIFQDLADPG